MPGRMSNDLMCCSLFMWNSLHCTNMGSHHPRLREGYGYCNSLKKEHHTVESAKYRRHKGARSRTR